MKTVVLPVLFALSVLALTPVLRAADPFFKPGAAIEKLFTGHGETEGPLAAPCGG